MRILNDFEGMTVLVSHDRDEIYQLCDSLILMDQGRVISTGKTEKIFQNPGTPLAARLTGWKNISRIQRISGHKVIALDWNHMELCVAEEVDSRVSHIGIKETDFVLQDIGYNTIACGQYMMNKLTTAKYVTLENGMWWKLPEEYCADAQSIVIPRGISIPAEKIILLREEK
jgi:molybdate transport system ATP-binding protein